jgi:ketosteroid isomerase-like protein
MLDPIADRLAIQDVMTRYATGVDTRDEELFAGCFTADVVVSGFGREPFEGLEAWIGFFRRALDRFTVTQHMISNHAVEVEGDRAKMRTYVQATHLMTAAPGTMMTIWGVYHSELVRDGDTWRISLHHVEGKVTDTREVRTGR